MSRSLLQPPPAIPPTDADRERSDQPAPRRPGIGRRALAALLTVAALLGGTAGAGLLVATGATDGGSTTTTGVVQSSDGVAEAGTGASAATLDASALYEGTSSGVVSITARGIASDTSVSPFGPSPDSESTATGSGFVIDGNGRILTAAHVVDGASEITVTFRNGTSRTAEVLGQDDATDVAVLEVDPSGLNLRPLELGSSGSLDVGDAVAAIGDPFGYERSMSTGIVSGLDRTIEAPNGFTVAHAIQTDAALNPGNSGGPVLNADGQVIGIADQVATSGSSESNSGVGFAVPIDLVKSELAKLEAGERVSHAYLGVGTSNAAGTTAGALVQSVASGSPADDAGLRSGDIATAIAGTRVEGSSDLVAAVAAHEPGDRVTVKITRGSESQDVSVTLGTQPTQSSPE
jgi:S1-C subfamily serine protease